MQGSWAGMLTSRKDATLHSRVTSDLLRRLQQHRATGGGFTTRYNLDKLGLAERHDTIVAAIQRKKNIKHWSRAWKVALIEAANPVWVDLTPTLTEDG